MWVRKHGLWEIVKSVHSTPLRHMSTDGFNVLYVHERPKIYSEPPQNTLPNAPNARAQC